MDDAAFSWDELKSDRCLAERGFDFAYATQIFDGDTSEYIDNRKPYPETRIQVYGRINRKAYRVVYTEIEPATKHIISAHRISEKELGKWHK